MRLVEIEKIVKDLNQNDPNNPELFNKLLELTVKFIRWKKYVTDYYEAQDIALLLTEDMYLKITKSGVKFYAPLEYIRVILPSVISYYRKCTNKEIIDVSDDPELAESLNLLGASSVESFNQYCQETNDKMYLAQLGSIIDDVMAHIKYKPGTVISNNLKLSLVLSLLKNEEYYYHLNESEKEYMKILIVSFRQVVGSHISGKDDLSL